MTIEYKFIARNNKVDEIRALEALKENIECKQKDCVEAIKSTILPIRNTFGKTSFSIIVKCEGEFDHCGYTARMNDPKRITNLLIRLSEKTRVNYEVLTPETLYSEISRTERFTRNGVSYVVHIKLEPFASSSLIRKTRIMIRIDAWNNLTGKSVNDLPYASFYKLENVPESYIRDSIDNAIEFATEALK